MTTTNETKIKKLTKIDKFNVVKAMLNGEKVEVDFAKADAIAFIDAEIALLVKKNGSDSKAAKAKRAENEAHAEKIKSFLATLPADSKGVTCTEIVAQFPVLGNSSKVIAVISPLVKTGVIKNTKEKGKSLYSLA